MVSITVNNIEYKVRANASVLQACEEVGIEIPRFCYHEKLSVAGSCRMCLVEVQKAPKPVVSCAMPVSKGMVIFTETPLVKKAREGVLEFLLINHPLDCPICDQGGECDLQDETLHFGSDRGRFFEFKRSVEDKECGPIIKTIMTRCIHCTRCVRFTSEVVGQESLGAFGRGQEMEIGTYVQTVLKTELSGNLVDLCPVGALTSKPYAFKARNWELQKVETIDFFDSMCVDVVVQTRKLTNSLVVKGENVLKTHEEILRVLPKLNGSFQDNWVSDKTRYAFDGLKNQRLSSVEILNRKDKKKELSWKDLVGSLSNLLQLNLNLGKVKRFNILVGKTIDLEDLYFLSVFLKLQGGSDIQYSNYKLKLNVDCPSFYLFNSLNNSVESMNALCLIGSNPRFEASLLNTRLRKEQVRKGLQYASLGAFSLLNYKQNHLGNGLRTFWALTENREVFTKKLLLTENAYVFFGIESLKNKGAYVLQNILRFLTKKMYLKNLKGERLSFIHTNLSTISFAHLGIEAGVRSVIYLPKEKDKKIDILFNIQNQEFQTAKWISKTEYTNVVSLTTHKENKKVISDILIPMKSFYEKNGYVFNMEGKLRKYFKVLNGTKENKTVSSFFGALLRLNANWKIFLNHLWFCEKEVSIDALLEKDVPSFNFNFFDFVEQEQKVEFFLMSPTIFNFYLNDIISANSMVMAECTLFLTKEQNFLKF